MAAWVRSRAPRGDRPAGRTPRASACGCIGHSAARRPQGAALNKYGKFNHARRTRRTRTKKGDPGGEAGSARVVPVL